MPANLAIHRFSARTPARAQPVAARLALQALGADLEDALPRSLPPQALLWLRRLQLQAPESVLSRPAPAAWRQDWIASGRERFDTALAQAARPALGPVPDSAPAVLFADAAEMLACLALAAHAGQLDHWWWRGLLGRAWPQWSVAWLARPQAQAGAVRLLLRTGQGAVVGDLRLAEMVAWDEGREVPVLNSALGEPVRGDAGQAGVVAARAEAVAGATRDAAGSPLPRAECVGLALARAFANTPLRRTTEVAMPQQSTPQTMAPASQPAAVADAFAAHVMRSPPRVARVVAEPSPVTHPSAPLASDATPAAVPSKRSAIAGSVERPLDTAMQPITPVAATALEPQAMEDAPAATRSTSPATPVHAASIDPAVVSPADAAPAPLARSTTTEAAAFERADAEANPQPPDTSPEPAAPLWPWPQAVMTRQAPLLFVINALLEDDLYPDFTRPRDPGLPVPLLALLAALSRAWRLPADDALQQVLADRCPAWEVPATMPAAPGAAAAPWPEWIATYARSLRRRLSRRLGLRTAWAPALTLKRPARLWLSESEWIAEFDLAAHDVAWRLAGLDRDPGWLPSAGCSLRFRFHC